MEEKRTVGQRFKGHLKRHKTKYITGGLITIGTGVGLYIGSKHSETIKTTVKNINFLIANREVTINNSTNITNILSRNGDAGHIMYCPEDDEWFMSKNELCKKRGITKSLLNKLTKGLINDIDGKTYIKVGEFNNDSPDIAS